MGLALRWDRRGGVSYSHGGESKVQVGLFENRPTYVNLSATELLAPSPCVIPDALVNNL